MPPRNSPNKGAPTVLALLPHYVRPVDSNDTEVLNSIWKLDPTPTGRLLYDLVWQRPLEHRAPQLSYHDICTLKPEVWLNDIAINGFCKILTNEFKGAGNILLVDSYLYARLFDEDKEYQFSQAVV